MKKILLLLSFFSPLALYSYSGDTQNFIIEENSICLNAPEEASKSYISTESSVSINAQWHAEITLAFSPTSSNYLRWYVMADSSNLSISTNAYYLQFGGTKRTISFYLLKNGKSTLVCEERDKLLDNSQNNIKVYLSRTKSNNWILNYILNDTLQVTSEFYENQINYSSFSGFHCVYTKTRSKSFCFANITSSGDVVLPPRIPQNGELIINEILFNPIDDGVDFVEILNLSDTTFDLSFCKLGNKKQTYDLPSYLLQPDSLVAITKDSAILCSQFNCNNAKNILQVEKMLPLPNDSGYICLLSDTLLIDALQYNAEMHHILLDNVEGISLERLFDGTWTSASTIFRATPGSQNSYVMSSGMPRDDTSQSPENASEEEFYTNSAVIHNYDSNYPETLKILYRLQQPTRVSMQVFSLAGFPVFTLLNSELIIGDGSIKWDGRGENSQILPVGMYIIFVESYTEDGNYSFKKIPVAMVP